MGFNLVFKGLKVNIGGTLYGVFKMKVEWD